MAVSPAEEILRFGLFELDVKAGQLRKGGMRIRLAQQPVQLLVTLLERPGEVVMREELRQRLWPQNVFVDFDHGLNKSVQKLRDALGDSAESPRYIETIPRVGYRFLAPVIGGARAASPESDGRVSRNANVPVADSPGGSTIVAETSHEKPGGKALWLVVSGCVILLVAGTWWLIHRRDERLNTLNAPIRSLAVLPLDNLSGDAGQNYFADGMTDELTTMLAKDSTLRIVSRTSAMQYKGVHRPLREIARALGVDGIVEGSVERKSDKTHMTLQLIQGPSDTHVWAQSYDRDANDLVSLPDDAALEIAKRTDSAVPNHTHVRYVSPEAHDAYLRGENFWHSNNSAQSGRYFQKAIELQPDYGLAWYGLSKYYGGEILGGDMDPREGLAPMEQAALKAAALDDSLPDAHLALCGAILFNEHDVPRADAECVRAIEMDPQYVEAYHFRARLLAAANRHDEGIAQEKIATQLAPSTLEWGLARSYFWARKYDEGIANALMRLQAQPRNPEALENLAELYRCKGMYAEAAQAWENMYSAQGDESSVVKVRNAFGRGGYPAVVQWKLDVLKDRSLKQYVSPVFFALLYAQVGKREEALEALAEAYAQRSPLLLWIQCDPAYDFLHKDARYVAIIEKMRKPPAY